METAPAIDGAALVRAREAAGLTQHQLARAVGVAGGERISAWEHGRSRPRTPDLLRRVADALGVSSQDLLVTPDAPSLRWMRFAAGLDVADLSDVDHTYLPAMAPDPCESNTGKIAKRLGKTPHYAATHRKRLIAAGAIEPTRRGYVEFTVPYLCEHVARYELAHRYRRSAQ